MSRATDAFEAILLDHICGLAPYTPEATLYIGLMTAVADAEVPTLTEVTGGSYARLAVTNDGTSWYRSGQILMNSGILSFVAASASWGTVTHWGIFDSPSGGDALIVGPLTNSVAVGIGATPRIAADKIQVNFAFRSNFMNAAMLDHVFGITPYTAPTDVDIALYTSAPTDAGGGTEVSSSGTDYDREEIPNDATSWTRTGSLIENDNDIEFPEATAAYGIVVAQAAFEAGTSNMMWWKNLEANQNIGIGSQFAFTPGQYRILMD
jgi:hypothetical protein